MPPPNAWSSKDVMAMTELQFCYLRLRTLQGPSVPKTSSDEPNDESEQDKSDGKQRAFAYLHTVGCKSEAELRRPATSEAMYLRAAWTRCLQRARWTLRARAIRAARKVSCSNACDPWPRDESAKGACDSSKRDRRRRHYQLAERNFRIEQKHGRETTCYRG